MNLYTLKCPNCGSSLEIEDGIDIFFCKYCGQKIMLEGQSKEAIKAKVSIKGMEHEENLADKKYEHERYKMMMEEKEKKRDDRSFLIIVCLMLLFVLFIIRKEIGFNLF